MVRIKAAIQSGSLIPIVELNKFDLIDFIGNSGKTIELQDAIVTHAVHGHRRLKTGNFLPIPLGEPHLLEDWLLATDYPWEPLKDTFLIIKLSLSKWMFHSLNQKSA